LALESSSALATLAKPKSALKLDAHKQDVYKQTSQPVYVLHTYPFKETSLVVELFSLQFGRIAAVAKGARRPHSAMRGMLQSFQLLEGAWSGKNELKTLHSLDWSAGLTLIKGEALMCGFYMNELLLRLLPREDAHENLFAYYQATLNTLATSPDLAITLRRFELKLLQEMGYAVPLQIDENDAPIDANKNYRYEAEYGACDLNTTKNGVQLSGKTMLDMARDDYADATTQSQSKQLMRYLLAYYLGDKPLHTRQLLIDLQGL
jgi:DNA repair protein RecO (recombination protein O)